MPEAQAPTSPTPEVPPVGRLAWMLFFEPVTLFHVLAEAGVSRPGGALLSLLRVREAPGRVYAGRMLLVLGLLAPMAALALAVAVGVLGTPLPRPQVLGVLLSGLLSGALWAAVASLPFGAALALALPVAGVVAISLLSLGVLPAADPLLSAVIIGAAPGGAAGVVFGVARAVSDGQPLSVARGMLTAALLGGLAAFLTVEQGGPLHAAVVAVSMVVGFALFCFRLVLWPLEALAQAVLFAVERLTGRSTLEWSPVLWHDLSYLPLPFLASHVALHARTDVDTARRVVASCFIAPGQRRTGRALQKELKQELFGRTTLF